MLPVTGKKTALQHDKGKSQLVVFSVVDGTHVDTKNQPCDEGSIILLSSVDTVHVLKEQDSCTSGTVIHPIAVDGPEDVDSRPRIRCKLRS